MSLYNLVRVISATTGTGTLTLGAAVSGCLTFAGGGVPDGAQVSYGISDGVNSEVGRGTYTSAGTTLSRDTVLASTNSGAKINCSGSEQVFITALAEDVSGVAPAAQMAADHTAEGIKTRMTANEAQAFGDVCFINSDGEMAIADADAIASSKVVGMALATISANAVGEYLLFGVARDDTWAWTPGGFVYLTVTGTSGNTLSQTAPTGTDDCVVIVGVAGKNADTLVFNPQLVIVERV